MGSILFSHRILPQKNGGEITMFDPIITDISAAIKMIAALHKAGLINDPTYHSILAKYAPAAWLNTNI